MIEPLRIVVDTREQSPWAWEPCDASVEIHGLVAGDYALWQDCEPVRGRDSYAVRFSIERKSLDDFLGTIGSGWDRFQRELDRMSGFPARVVIVEGNFAQCCFSGGDGRVSPPPHNHPLLSPRFVMKRMSDLMMMGVEVFLAGNAELASAQAYSLFRRRFETFVLGAQ